METELANFLTFIQDAIDHKKEKFTANVLEDEDETEPPTSIEFEELVPPSTQGRKMAVSAFMNVLNLGSGNMLRATQAEPYGSIELSLIPA